MATADGTAGTERTLPSLGPGRLHEEVDAPADAVAGDDRGNGQQRGLLDS